MPRNLTRLDHTEPPRTGAARKNNSDTKKEHATENTELARAVKPFSPRLIRTGRILPDWSQPRMARVPMPPILPTYDGIVKEYFVVI